MKKRILSLLLVLALLPFGSVFAAGTAEDPLISFSYVKGTFIPEMYSALKVMLSEAVEDELSQRSASGCMVRRSLRAGSTLILSEGQSFVLLSGSAQLCSGQGTVADVSKGTELKEGELTVGSRYIVCENTTAELSVSCSSLMLLSPNAAVQRPEEEILVSPFSDVVSGIWWHDDIVRAYNRGLVNGMTPTTFEPRGNLTVIQCIKLAACMHQLYHEGKVSLTNSPVHPWYQSYLDYATENSIIDGTYPDYKASATRRQFVEIFSAALPESEYVPINDIPQGSIGDIHTSGDWVDTVYLFYRAGILTGYTPNDVYKAHDFGPDSFITRAELATIMNRMFDSEARVSFTID